jgi:membrane protease YdiL (CAAX protease family)
MFNDLHVEQGRVQIARRGLVIYAAVLIVLSVVFETTLFVRGRPIAEQMWLVFLLMWSPAVASIVARLALREGFADVSFRWNWSVGWRSLLLAWSLPILIGALAYGGAWAVGLARFEVPAEIRARYPDAPGAVLFLSNLGVNLTLGVLIGALSAAGEEIGWRGFMLTRLIEASVPRPVLVSGLVWGLWHLPLIVSGQYAAGPHPLLSAPIFLIAITSASYVYARIRLHSGSVWPPVVAHAAWNSGIQGPFDQFFGGDASRSTNIWIGESGICTVLVLVVVGIVAARPKWTVRFRPDAPP